MEKQAVDAFGWLVREATEHGLRHVFWVVCIVISTLFFGWGYRRRIKALESSTKELCRENKERRREEDRRQKEADRRIETLERFFVAARAQSIVVQLPSSSHQNRELAESFSAEAIVNKRRESTLKEDFEVARGSGKIAACLIFQEGDYSEAERILNIFESQPHRIDEAYPYVAFATKLADQDEMMQAHDALSRLPDSAQWQVDEAIEWALAEIRKE